METTAEIYVVSGVVQWRQVTGGGSVSRQSESLSAASSRSNCDTQAGQIDRLASKVSTSAAFKTYTAASSKHKSLTCVPSFTGQACSAIACSVNAVEIIIKRSKVAFSL